jgi:hypothetical protein
MKTRIRSLIIICALGLVGVLNTNATSSYKTSCIAETLEEQINSKSENLNSTEFVFNEDADAAIDYQAEAQLVTKWIADNEEAKTIQMLIDRGIFVSNEEMVSFADEAKSENLNSAEFDFNEDVDVDYQMEAQLVTKLIADNEEAKTIQMLIDKGLFVSNEEQASLADEAKSENLNSSEFVFIEDAAAVINYQKEAQLVTKWIADKEEAKAIQKLIEEGKLAENK